MANSFENLRWILDTTGTITSDAVRIRRMMFVPTADDSVCDVNDGNGDQIFYVGDVTAAAWPGQFTTDFGDVGRNAFGFVVATLGGTLYVDLI